MRPVPGVIVTRDFEVDPGSGVDAHPTTVPIVINNFNRLSYLKRLIAALSVRGYDNTYVIDNCSTYEPLLQYYRDSGLRVFHLDANVGYLALWTTAIGASFVDAHYVYTDVDIEPASDCPDDFIARFAEVLTRYPDVAKVGFGLKIDDLPATYDLRDQVVEHEGALLTGQVEPGLHRAPIDTTFALYRPGAAGGAWLPSMRTGAPYLARHLPWYTDSSRPDDEESYYRRTATTSSHWTMLDQVEESGSMTVMLWGQQVRVAANNAARWNMVSRGEWKPDVYEALDCLLAEGTSYLELGSGIGETALYAARRARVVYAVECDAANYETLAQNVALNAGEIDTIEPVHACIAPRSGPAGVVSIGDLEGAHPLGECSLVRIDIGGDEFRVLPAMTPFLRKIRPSLHVTLHPRRFYRIRGSSLLAKASVAIVSVVSTTRILWLLRFYAHVYDGDGAPVTCRDLPRICRGIVTLIFRDTVVRWPVRGTGAYEECNSS
jgi:hypothetical protein